MVERAAIRNTFIYSPIFETVEDLELNPFEFRTDNLQKRSPQEMSTEIRHQGYLLRIEVSFSEN